MKLLVKAAKYLALTLSTVCVLGLIYSLYVLYDGWDAQGEASRDCMVTELPLVPNGSGMAATGHETICALVFGTDEATYIYLHKSEETDSRRSLVFRFSNTASPRPNLVWANSSTLRISVDKVYEVTKQVDSVEGIKILYTIGKEEVARGSTLRIHMYEAGVMSILLIVFALISGAISGSLVKDAKKTI